MMLRLLRCFAPLLVLISPPALADPQRHPTPIAVQAEPAPLRPALWVVSDADTTIYLFGTIHVLPQGSTWFAGVLARAADASDELVTEIGQVDPQEVTRAVVDLGLLHQGPTLRERMTPEDRTALERALAELGKPPEAFDRVKPWFAANSLMLMRLQRTGISGVNGPESDLDARFSANARPRVALETIRYQLGLFDALPEAAQLRYLREVIEAQDDLVGEFNRIAAQWGAGETDLLASAMPDSDDPEIIQRLLLDRNHAWSQWIKARLERPGTVFMAVGAGHLAGQGSVQDELATLGIATTRVQ